MTTAVEKSKQPNNSGVWNPCTLLSTFSLLLIPSFLCTDSLLSRKDDRSIQIMDQVEKLNVEFLRNKDRLDSNSLKRVFNELLFLRRIFVDKMTQIDKEIQEVERGNFSIQRNTLSLVKGTHVDLIYYYDVLLAEKHKQLEHAEVLKSYQLERAKMIYDIEVELATEEYKVFGDNQRETGLFIVIHLRARNKP